MISDVGQQMVTLRVEDHNNNTATCTASINIIGPDCSSSITELVLPNEPVEIGNSINLNATVILNCSVTEAIQHGFFFIRCPFIPGPPTELLIFSVSKRVTC